MKRVAKRGCHGVGVADVLHLRSHIHHDFWSRQPGPPQHVFGSLVGRPAAGGLCVWPSCLLQQIGIGDRRTDRIGVGVAMPKNA